MKYLNSFKKEIKHKWSTRLLVGVFAFILCSSFASTLLLKREYDKQKNQPPFPLKNLSKAINQPFKHIKIEKCFRTNVVFDTSKQYAVYIDEKNKVEATWSKSIYILNDTLFIKNIDKNEDDFSSNFIGKTPNEAIPIRVFAPEIASVTISVGHFDINSLNQKSMSINLLKSSYFYLKNANQDLDALTISMADNSNVNLYSEKQNQRIYVKNMDVTLTESCSLMLGNAFVENLKLNGNPQGRIELSTQMLNYLMKK
jgi:hypothetical protein